MLSVELKHIADVLDATHQAQNVSKLARLYSSTITKAIWEHTVVNNVFAYETDGFGSRYVMDDANVPVCPHPSHTLVRSRLTIVRQSLLSLPYLGFLDTNHPAYVKTRKVVLSRGNPYYAARNFSGVGYAQDVSGSKSVLTERLLLLTAVRMLTLGTPGRCPTFRLSTARTATLRS